MSVFNDAMQTCPNLQADINAIWQSGRSLGADDRFPLAEFLTSAVNTRGIVQNVTPGGGKIRTVELRYWPRLLESLVSENQDNPNCSASGFYGDNATTYTIDPSENLQTGEQVSISDLELMCRDNPMYFQELIARHIDVLDRRVATHLTDQAAAEYGTWGSGLFTTGNAVGNVNANDEFVINTTVSSGTAPAPFSWAKLRNALDDIGMPSDVAIFSGQALREYFQYTNAGCCADSGIDLSAMLAQYGYAVAYDKRLAGASALNSQLKGMVLAPGALQVLRYTRAQWKEGVAPAIQAGADYFYTTVVSPRLGLPYDLTVKDSCGTINITLTATTKVVSLPDDMYATGDAYRGVNGVAKVLVTNS